jgi:hypothetical protein
MIENLDYENAKKILEEKINREPNNTEAIDTLAEILLNLDETDSVIKVKFLKRIIHQAIETIYQHRTEQKRREIHDARSINRQSPRCIQKLSNRSRNIHS